MDKKDKIKKNNAKKDKDAKDVANSMLENMKANMENPNFFDEKDKIRQDALNKILEKRRKSSQ